MLRRLWLCLAWRMYVGLHYSWHVAWHKAAYRDLASAPRRAVSAGLRLDARHQHDRRGRGREEKRHLRLAPLVRN